MVQISVISSKKLPAAYAASTSSRLDPVNDVTESDMWDPPVMNSDFHSRRNRPRSNWCRPSYIPITFILILIVLVVLLPLLDHNDTTYKSNVKSGRNRNTGCEKPCKITLVESIPEGMNYTDGGVQHVSTYSTWKQLINMSESSIDIASYYWTMRGADVVPNPSAWQGEDVFYDLIEAGLNRSIKITIAQNKPTEFQPNPDTEFLEDVGAATVTSLDFDQLLGAGVLHTKFWIVDKKHVYIGSANMDWRSLTQVKELGAVVYNCSCLAEDLGKVFQVYYDLGGKTSVPDQWPDSYSTQYNQETPMNVTLNDTSASVYVSSAPPPFLPRGRTGDVDAILNIISKAQKFIYVAVMDYFPLMIFTHHVQYWPVIEDALRTAVVDRSVNLCLMASHWNNTRPMMYNFLQSLAALDDFNRNASVQVKLFVVPSNSSQAAIPFARVNHNKYMVTDNAVYIGTSNWSGDYFVNTAGVGLVITEEQAVRYQLQEIFERDWYSQYTTPVTVS